MSTARSAKIALRRAAKAALAAVPAELKAVESQRVCSRLINSEVFQRSHNVAVYSSFENELDTFPLIKAMFESGKTVYFPRIFQVKRVDETNSSNEEQIEDCMEMLQVRSIDDLLSLEPNKWGIREPKVEDSQGVARQNGLQGECILDLVVVPGLAFDKKGGRLGRGKGYYDRFLREFLEKTTSEARPNIVAMALNCQVVDDVPMTDRDTRVQALYTPDEAVHF